MLQGNLKNYFEKRYRGFHALLYVIFLLSLLSAFDTIYIFDIFSTFRFQYFIVSIILAVVFIFHRKPIAFIACLSIIINLWFLAPTWPSLNLKKSIELSILFSNIHSSNTKYGRFKNLIKVHEPKIIVVQEMTSSWKENLSEILNDFKYQILISREDNFGIAVYSKIPFLDKKVFTGKAGVESIYFKIMMRDKEVSFVSMHPLPPVTHDYWGLRNDQYREISEFLREISGEKILIGDLNTVPWSSHLNKLKKDVSLISLNTFNDTWHSSFPFFFRIKLDHAFISTGLEGKMSILKDIGSDHLPALIEVGLK